MSKRQTTDKDELNKSNDDKGEDGSNSQKEVVSSSRRKNGLSRQQLTQLVDSVKSENPRASLRTIQTKVNMRAPVFVSASKVLTILKSLRKGRSERKTATTAAGANAEDEISMKNIVPEKPRKAALEAQKRVAIETMQLSDDEDDNDHEYEEPRHENLKEIVRKARDEGPNDSLRVIQTRVNLKAINFISSTKTQSILNALRREDKRRKSQVQQENIGNAANRRSETDGAQIGATKLKAKPEKLRPTEAESDEEDDSLPCPPILAPVDRRNIVDREPRRAALEAQARIIAEQAEMLAADCGLDDSSDEEDKDDGEEWMPTPFSSEGGSIVRSRALSQAPVSRSRKSSTSSRPLRVRSASTHKSEFIKEFENKLAAQSLDTSTLKTVADLEHEKVDGQQVEHLKSGFVSTDQDEPSSTGKIEPIIDTKTPRVSEASKAESAILPLIDEQQARLGIYASSCLCVPPPSAPQEEPQPEAVEKDETEQAPKRRLLREIPGDLLTGMQMATNSMEGCPTMCVLL